MLPGTVGEVDRQLFISPAVYSIVDGYGHVNGVIDGAMNFKTATDRISAYVSHTEIAEAAGISVQSIRQARLDPRNPNYRSPPAGWEKVLLRLARERSKYLKAFIVELERG